MFFRQILHEDLGCASYLIASDGEAIVIDPKWGIAEYLATADEAGARIRYVLETHFHADHVSGRRRLSLATGALERVPRDPGRPGAGGLRDGDLINIGDVEVRVIAAPGHRPEHLAFLVGERNAAGEPARLVSGDSLLVGGLARPDLAIDATEGARALWGSIRRIVQLGERVEVWPGHVGGSLCGNAALSERTSTTIGDELQTNPLLSTADVEGFVESLTSGIPGRPPRVERVVSLNVDGAPEPGPLGELDASCLARIVGHVCVVDARTEELFDGGHIVGSINVPAMGRMVGTRVGWATTEDEPIVIVADTRDEATRVADLLHSAGVWNLLGISVADPAEWIDADIWVRRATAALPERVAEGLASGEHQLVDVRDAAEWSEDHVDGSINLPLSVLGDGRNVELDDERPVAVACVSGGRAAIAASILRRRGYDAVRMSGGVGDLAAARVRAVT